ncbi:bifunctional adenosylcobinamide kinase/adenosylcobinamide-phosphate guanylyltransferase [Solibacillus sp. FSL H8-0538]|uniref:bifunctional adenosylcobinamide kinase/adenosylcobinamide-phosphate guanylyltransferase n=1 Tax=Solibacillus sp. FSL H8-0538 TaxID=2921400 RepID=UPI0030FB24DB
MQVILGGAFNGKRQYVKTQLKAIASHRIFTFEGELPADKAFTKEQFIIIGSFEKIIETRLHIDEDIVAEKLSAKLVQLDQETTVICICTDMSRGVVPLDQKQRQLRDTCGRLYQKLCEESEQVVRVWYGIPQLLKGE